ncbi:MAG: response regulator transcription factor, partial [Cytophagales bacterium]|nr:response regulator transcription factor [Cytophagales bacterium]
DHPLILDGLEAILSNVPNFKVVGRASNGAEASRFVKRKETDIVLMDIEMPVMNGIEATREIKRKKPLVKILAITMYNDNSFIKEMLDAGADGYILKNANRQELIDAIEKVVEGERYISQPIMDTIFKKFGDGETAVAPKPDINITPRELELIKLLYNGSSNKQIAEILNISPRTVETHRASLMKKIGVKKVSGIVQFAIKHELHLNF